MSLMATKNEPLADHDRVIRVMLVDDSAVVRGLLGRWVSAEKNMEVVSRCHNGLHAVREMPIVRPTLVVLDIEMPQMDGLEALPLLLEACADARILIASSLSKRNAEISLTALTKGAHDYIPKPASNRGLATSDEFRLDLIARINALCIGRGGRINVDAEQPAPSVGSANAELPNSDLMSNEKSLQEPLQKEKAALPVLKSADVPKRSPAKIVSRSRSVRYEASKKQFKAIPPARQAVTLAPFNKGKPEVLCIGASTGGPRALQQLLKDAGPDLGRIPILLTQHMPKSFTSVFAQHLNKVTTVSVLEAQNDDVLKPGHVYVAPGDRHLVLKREGSDVFVVLNDEPPMNFCKPAVNKMFASAAECYGSGVLSVILTGMGQDGAEGARSIVERGGNVVVQDAASSIVWGMPGTAYKAGIASGIYSLDAIGKQIGRIVREGVL